MSVKLHYNTSKQNNISASLESLKSLHILQKLQPLRRGGIVYFKWCDNFYIMFFCNQSSENKNK